MFLDKEKLLLKTYNYAWRNRQKDKGYPLDILKLSVMFTAKSVNSTNCKSAIEKVCAAEKLSAMAWPEATKNWPGKKGNPSKNPAGNMWYNLVIYGEIGYPKNPLQSTI